MQLASSSSSSSSLRSILRVPDSAYPKFPNYNKQRDCFVFRLSVINSILAKTGPISYQELYQELSNNPQLCYISRNLRSDLNIMINLGLLCQDKDNRIMWPDILSSSKTAFASVSDSSPEVSEQEDI